MLLISEFIQQTQVRGREGIEKRSMHEASSESGINSSAFFKQNKKIFVCGRKLNLFRFTGKMLQKASWLIRTASLMLIYIFRERNVFNI